MGIESIGDNLRLMSEKAKGCDRKKGYDTIVQARRAAAYVWAQTGNNLKVYQCQFCGKYHLTHKLDYKPADGSAGTAGAFATSPNFTGNRAPVKWDRNDLEVREQNRKEQEEMCRQEREAARPAVQEFSEEAIRNSEAFVIDQERYITGKNRHKHKKAAQRKISHCRKCGKPIKELDATQLCEDCRKDGDALKVIETLDAGDRTLDVGSKKVRRT